MSFNPLVSLKEVIKTPLQLNSRCHFYSFPLGVISIINFLTLCLILILSITAMFTGIASLDGWKILAGIFILFGGIFLNLFMFYTQAYLIKGCQCSKLPHSSNIQFNILIRPEYIGELEVNGNKYNYIIDIKENIKQMINLFEKSYDTEKRQQTSDVNQSIWKQPLYKEWEKLIEKEVNIYQPEFIDNNETEFTNHVIDSGGITFHILGKTLLPILIKIIINKDKFRESNMLYRNLLYNSDFYRTIKNENITLDNTEQITIKNLLETKDSNNNNKYQYDIYDIIKYIYIYFIISKKKSKEFKELSDILNNKSA